MKIYNLQVNHVNDPIGYQFDKVTFSYKVSEATGKKQTAARICVSTTEDMSSLIYDSGFSSDISSLGTTVNIPLSPYTRYYWNVSVKSDAKEEAVSDTSFFETAKLDDPWTAKWITCDKSDRHPVFLKGFSVNKEVNKARLYITGLGLYHATINGLEVTRERLTPYYTDYNNWIQYQTYDIKELLESDNTISVTLGNGWYSGRFGFSSSPDMPGFYGDDYKLLAELHITYQDGSIEIIKTDESWDVSLSNYTFSNIYDGEHRDDTLEPVAPVKASILADASAFPVKERLSLPVIIHEELPAIALIDTPAGEKVFDMGQNLAGSFRLHLKEPRGTKIHIQVGEVLQGGNFYRDNLRTALAEYYYISDGSEIDLEPLFTFYGYRYIKVEGASDLKKSDMTALAYYSDIASVGKLVTGNEMLNKLLSNISWGQKGNFIDVPTDCPQRDERMGWTADTQVFVPTACFMTDSYAFYRKYLYELRGEQGETGRVTDVIPSTGVEGGCSVWGDAATIIPWTLYEYYGDKEILKESFESMKAWVDYVRKTDGDNRNWANVFQYGDWLALDSLSGAVDEVKGGTDDAFIGYVYYMYSARLTKMTAEILGYDEDVLKYREIEDEIRNYILDEYYSKTGRCAVSTQTAYTLSLYHDLTVNPEKTLDQLVNHIAACKYKLRTGFVGTPMVNKVLSANGQDELAYKLLYNEEYPGWLYEINLGATTVWERWNSMNPDGTVSSTGMNSFNHYAYGSIGEWMFNTIGGLIPDSANPGFKGVIIRPIPDYKTQKACLAYDSPSGCYEVEWEVTDIDKVHMKVTVPFDCTAMLQLPYAKDSAKEQTLLAGTHEFTYTAIEPLKKVYSVDTPIRLLLADSDVKNILQKNMPQIFQVPGSMVDKSIRELMALSNRDESMLEGMNLMLQSIN